MVNDLRSPALIVPVEGGPDLVYLHQDVRIFLAGIDSFVVAETILVVVRLAGNAFRYGAAPVVLALQFVAHHRRLRIQVSDQRPFSWPNGHCAVPLDRYACTQGREPSRNGGTTTWVEIAVEP